MIRHLFTLGLCLGGSFLYSQPEEQSGFPLHFENFEVRAFTTDAMAGVRGGGQFQASWGMGQEAWSFITVGIHSAYHVLPDVHWDFSDHGWDFTDYDATSIGVNASWGPRFTLSDRWQIRPELGLMVGNAYVTGNEFYYSPTDSNARRAGYWNRTIYTLPFLSLSVDYRPWSDRDWKISFGGTTGYGFDYLVGNQSTLMPNLFLGFLF